MDFSVPFFRILWDINQVFIWALTICFFNQIFHMTLSIFVKKKRFPAAKESHRFGFLIAARNEERVIGDLVRSIRAQDYPQELLHVFVVADNCTDRTAAMAREAGATVFERFNDRLRGKSYALDDALKRILAEYEDLGLEAVVIMDADNLLHPRFVAEMNKAFDKGHKIATGYRAPRNFSDSWAAGSSSFMYLRESRQVNRSRARLGIGTFVFGTGFYISMSYVRQFGGWPFHTLTEDSEISTVVSTLGDKVAFCEDAFFYDEQPAGFRDFWRQRLRWCRGNHQVFFKRIGALCRSFLRRPSLTKWETGTFLLPLPAVSFIWFILYTLLGLGWAVFQAVPAGVLMQECLQFCIADFTFPLLFGYVDAVVLLLQCNKQIDAPAGKKVRYMLLFPVGMYMLLITTALTLFKKVGWQQISHTGGHSAGQAGVSPAPRG